MEEEGTGIEDGGCLLTFNAAVVSVVVVEFMGREGILDGGFEPELCFA